jgi:hypothetical protein
MRAVSRDNKAVVALLCLPTACSLPLEGGFGTARWQLADQNTPVTGVPEGAPMSVYGPSRHYRHQTIGPELEVDRTRLLRSADVNDPPLTSGPTDGLAAFKSIIAERNICVPSGGTRCFV